MSARKWQSRPSHPHRDGPAHEASVLFQANDSSTLVLIYVFSYFF